MLVLIGLRNRLRAEEPLRHRPRAARQARRLGPPALPDRAHARRHVQRPRRPADGQPRQPLRPQRPARVHRPRARRPAARAEPAARQPRAADARRVPAGDDAQPARRRVDPVRGARLVQPRQERAREPVGGPARRRRPVARAPDADPAHAPRPERRPGRAADVRHRRHPLVGRLADLRPRPGVRRRAAHAASTASCSSTSTACSPQELEAHVDLTGVAGNFWVGLALLHSLFMREHNAICDHLHATHPELSDDELFDKARLVIAALMAKIHTVEWTPAIIAHPTTVHGAARELVGPRRRAARQAVRPPHVERGDPRHPRLADEPPRRAVLAHRGVRRRLPHAPADPRRVQLPLARGRPRAPGARRCPSSARCTCASG